MADADSVSPSTSRVVKQDNARPAKRSRVTRACDQCRASRERCDGRQPACQTCCFQQRSCSYEEIPRKRGIQPNYIRTLELTLAWLFQTFPESATELSSGLPKSGGSVQGLLSGKSARASDELHQSWRKCLVSKQIEQLLSGTTIESAPAESSPPNHEGGQPDAFAFTSLPAGAIRMGIPSIEITDQPDINSESPAQMDADGPRDHPSAAVQLPANAWDLIEHYFAFTHAWIPMVDKLSIVKLMYAYPEMGIPREQLTIADHAELWSILALASAQTSEDSQGCETARLREIAVSLLPQKHSYEVPHIRAMLVLAVLNIQEDNMLAAWFRIGLATRVLSLFGLIGTLGQKAKRCLHVHLAAFILENALSIRLRAPGQFGTDYIAKFHELDEDGLDEWESWHDPEDNTRPAIGRTPTQAISTLNGLFRAALESVKRYTKLHSPDFVSVDEPSLVFALVRNATLREGRKRPADIVSRPTYQSLSAPPVGVPDNMQIGLVEQQGGEQVANSHGPSEPYKDKYQSEVANRQDLILDPATVDETSLSIVTTSEYHTDGLYVSEKDMHSSTNIFDQLASLDAEQPLHEPKFLQNLGFAPDIDLKEFFGDDYQPSDPLLTYMLPPPNGLNHTT